MALKFESKRPIIGQQFGNYRIEKLLDQGGFATIYLGKHHYLGTRAAIKILDPPLGNEEVQKFFSEAHIAARLMHPHIIRVLDFGLQNHVPFLVMDYAPHGSLRQLHPEGQVLPVSTVLNYVWQIVDGLQYIHNCGLIHQDLKPENILLGRNHKILLSDFGIAITEQVAYSPSKIRVVGTISYMAPEQIQGNPCFASDQYALAVIIYEWLCGELPFHGSPLEIARQHLLFPPPSMLEKVPDIPSAIEHIVMRALAKQPEQRFSSVKALAIALEQGYRDTLTPVALRYQSIPALPPGTRGPASLRPFQAKQQRIQSQTKKIAKVFAATLLIETGLGSFLYAFRLSAQVIWILLSLCLVLLSLLFQEHSS